MSGPYKLWLMNHLALIFSFLLSCCIAYNADSAWPAPQLPLKPKDGIIMLDHGTKLVGKFRVENKGDFFTITPQKFSARLFTKELHNPPSQSFYVSFQDYTGEEKRPEKYTLKMVNDFQQGISFSAMRDQRIIVQNILHDELVHGTVLYLGHKEYKKYVGEIKNFMPNGVGMLEFTNGQILSGRFAQGHLNGPYLDSKRKVILQFLQDKLVSTTPLQKDPCHDPYLGEYHLHQGTCKDAEVKAHSANFKDHLLVFSGIFKKGKLWKGEIIPMSPNTQGTIAKIENGLPTGVVRIQKKNSVTLGTLIEGKLNGQVTTYDFTNGERFIGHYERGKKHGPFRVLNYNNEILKKGQYKNDALDGTLFTYDEKVRLKSAINYQDGKKLSKAAKP